MRKLYNTKLINRPEMKFYLVLDYTLPSSWPKSTQVDIQNDGGSLGLVMSLKTHSHLSHLIKRESVIFSLRQYCLDLPIFTMTDSKFHFSPTFTSNLFLLNQKKKRYIIDFFYILFSLCLLFFLCGADAENLLNYQEFL